MCQARQCGDTVGACHALLSLGCLLDIGPALLFLSLFHSHVPRCGVDVMCSLIPLPTGWGIVSGLCLYLLSGHALYSVCPTQHLTPHKLTMLHFEPYCPLLLLS